jgi:hypothetical protein
MEVELVNKTINPRLCIEETILHFNPDISDKDLLDLREQIYYNVWEKTHSPYGFSTYGRDYYLYSRKKSV